MDPAVIGAIFTGVASIATVVTGYLLKRTENVAANVDDLRVKFDAAIRHIYELRGVMTAHDLDVPEMPDELTERRRRRHRHSA